VRSRLDYVVDGFRLFVEGQGLSKHTLKNYSHNTRLWLDWCEANNVNYLAAKKMDVRSFLGFLLATRKPATVQTAHISLRAFYKYLIETEQFSGESPAAIKPIRKRETEPVEPFTPDEMLRMYRACRTHQELAVYLLLISCGLRRSEVYGIRKDHINTEIGTIRILGKGAKYRFVSPGPMVMEALREALRFEDRLCPQATDDVVERIVKRLAERALVRGRITPHRFRHSYAVHFLDAGGSLEDLMQVLGHARVDMSLYYARAHRQRRAIKAQEQMQLAERLLEQGIASVRAMPVLATGS